MRKKKRGLLQDLSVFADGWTIEMADAVCADWDVDTLLPSLVDKSLVVAEPQNDGMRYKFLETIRQYARDRLMVSGRGRANPPPASAVFCHVHICRGYAGSNGDRRVFRRAVPDLDNFRAALTWGLEEDPLSALELAGNLAPSWSLGPVVEGLAWIDRALEIVERDLDPDLVSISNRRLKKALADGYLARSLMIFPLGHNEKAYEAAKTSLDLYQGLGDEDKLTIAYTMFGLAGISMGRKEGSLEAVEKGIALAEARSNSFLYATLLNIKGLAKIYLEMDIPAAVKYMEAGDSDRANVRDPINLREFRLDKNSSPNAKLGSRARTGGDGDPKLGRFDLYRKPTAA